MRKTDALAGLLFLSAALVLAGAVGAADVDRAIDTDNIAFNPDSITVDEGDVVTIQLTNSDVEVHTFELDAFATRADLPLGADTSVTFTASQAGTFQFYCAVPGHSVLDESTGQRTGMVGTLTVVAAQAPSGGIGLEIVAIIVVLVIVVVAVVVMMRKKGKGSPPAP